jgi:hypothetical protein
VFLSEELPNGQEFSHNDIDPLEALSFTFPANVAGFDKSNKYPSSNGERRSHAIAFLVCGRLRMGHRLPFETV